MRKKNFAPKLYPLNNSIYKEWFIKYCDEYGKEWKVRGKMNTFTTKRERLKEAKRLIDEINNVPKAPPKRNDIPALLDNLLEYKKPFLAKKSYQSYFSIICLFSTWYRSTTKLNKEVKPSEYIRELHVKGLHKNTIRNKLIVLKLLCAELVQEKKIKENPFEGMKLKRVKASSKLPFNDTQITQLKQHIKNRDKQLWFAIELMYYLYLRPNEVRQLKINDILFEERKLCLTGTIAKDKDTIYKSIPAPLVAELETIKDYPKDYYLLSKEGNPGTKILSMNKLCSSHREILRELNYNTRYTLYSWVHTGIKKAALSGIPIKQLQLQKGHSDLNMFNEYLKDLGIDDCKELKNNFPIL